MAIFVAMLVTTGYVARRSALEELLQAERSDLRLYIANLTRELEKDRYRPAWIADDARMRQKAGTLSGGEQQMLALGRGRLRNGRRKAAGLLCCPKVAAEAS